MTVVKVLLIFGTVGASLAAALRFGHLAALPFFMVITMVPLLWSFRLMRVIRTGVITSRFRPSTGSGVHFALTSRDEFSRSVTPFRFWAAFVREVVLFVIISTFAAVPLIGTILEGGPKG